VSTRETKKLATELTSSGNPSFCRRSSALMYASATFSYAATENSSVTFTLIPSYSACSMAGTPSGVPGILIITLARSTRCQNERTCSSVPSVS
jgi:hypothetical protein